MKVIESVPTLEAAQRRYDLRNSAAIFVGDLVIVGGLTAVDSETGEIMSGEFSQIAHRSIDTLEGVLSDIGLSLDHVVKVNAFVPNAGNFSTWNAVFIERFTAPYPCRTTVCSPLAFGDIEIDVTAATSSRLSG